MKLVVFFLASLVICASSQTFAQNSTELKRRKDALTREIESLNNNLNQTSSNKRLSLKQIKALNAQIHLREAKIGTINSEIFLLKNQISRNTNTVYALQSQLVQLKKEYAKMILFAFRNKDSYNKLMFIFAAHDFNQAYKRVKYLHQIAQYRQKQAKEITNTERSLNIKIVDGISMKSAQIYDLTGRIVLESNFTNDAINVSSLTTGNYILLMKDDNGKGYSQKFIKE